MSNKDQHNKEVHQLGSTNAEERISQVLSAVTDLFLNSDIQSLYFCYFTNFGTLQDLFFQNPHFNLLFCGDGYDGIPSAFHLHPNKAKEELLLSAKQPKQQVLYVHKCLCASNKLSPDEEENRLLLLSPTEDQETGFITLSFCHVTQEMMRKVKSGIEVCQCDGTPLSSRDEAHVFSSGNFYRAFQKQVHPHLCYLRSVLASINMPTSENVLNQETLKSDPTECFDLSDEEAQHIYGLRIIPAIHYPEWFQGPVEWTCRTRASGWPERETIDKVQSMGCHLVPSASTAGTYWSSSFAMAEQCLLQTLTPVQVKLLLLVQAVLETDPCLAQMVTAKLLKWLFFWILEDLDKTAWTDTKVLTCVGAVFERLLNFCRKRHFPHYFQPTLNAFHDVGDILKLQKCVESVLANPLEALLKTSYMQPLMNTEVITSTLTIIHNDGEVEEFEASFKSLREWVCGQCKSIVLHVQGSLLSSWEVNIKLLVLSLRRRLYAESLDESIRRHEEVIDLLDHTSHAPDRIQHLIKILHGNLGCLYHAKLAQCKSVKEKSYYLKTAEGYLQEASEMNKNSGMVKLANFFYMQKNYKKANELLSTFLTESCIDLTEDFQSFCPVVNCDSQFDHLVRFSGDVDQDRQHTISEYTYGFQEQLWDHWVRDKNDNYLLYGKLEETVIPTGFLRSMSFARRPYLGLFTDPLGIFPCVPYAFFLKCLTLVGLEKSAEADELLLKVQKWCLSKDTKQGQEKEAIAYLNILGHCYLGKNDKEKAMEVFRKSARLMPNFSNPGRVQLTTLVVSKALWDMLGKVRAKFLPGVFKLGFAFFLFGYIIFRYVQPSTT